MFPAQAKAGDSATPNQTSQGLSRPQRVSGALTQDASGTGRHRACPRIRAQKLAGTVRSQRLLLPPPSLGEATTSLRGVPAPPTSVLKGLRAAPQKRAGLG